MAGDVWMRWGQGAGVEIMYLWWGQVGLLVVLDYAIFVEWCFFSSIICGMLCLQAVESFVI